MRKKLISIILAIAVIIGTTSAAYIYSNLIPLIQMDLTSAEKAKLDIIGSVKLSKAGYFNIDCKSYSLYEYSYVIVSSDTKRTEDYAKWSCGHSLKYIDCPEIDVKIVNSHAEINAGLTSKKHYSLERVKQCAALAIKHAPTEFRHTSDDVIKDREEEENLNSYNR